MAGRRPERAIACSNVTGVYQIHRWQVGEPVGEAMSAFPTGKAAAWISKRVGRKISTTSGWRTLRHMGQTPKRPRPRHKNADPEAQEAFKEAAAEADGRSTGAVSGRGGGDLGDG
jgi:hypothetical protein